MPRKAISSWKSPRGGASAPLPRPCQSLKAVGALVGVDADVFAVAVVDGDERRFETLEDLRLALLEFADWYNSHWLVARHGHRTPAHVGADQQSVMNLAA